VGFRGRLGVGGRRPQNRMDGPLWRRLRVLWFVAPARTMGGPIVLRPARALAQVGRLLGITSYLCLFYLDLLLSDQPVDQADGGWRSASSRSDEGKLFEGRV
jgi:hypothetical protein